MSGKSGAGQVGNLAPEADEDEEGRRRNYAPNDSLVHDEADGLGGMVGDAASSVGEQQEAEETQRDDLGGNSIGKKLVCVWRQFDSATLISDLFLIVGNGNPKLK